MSISDELVRNQVFKRAMGQCECNYPYHTHSDKHGKLNNGYRFHWRFGSAHGRIPTSNVVIVVCSQCHTAIASFQGRIH